MRSRFCLLLSFAATVAACSSSPNVDVPATSQSSPLYLNSSWVWENHRVPVCWEVGDTDWVKERQWVQDQISKTWQWYSGVKFEEWTICQWYLSTDAQLRIKVSDERPHTNAEGTLAGRQYGGMTLNFSFANWSQSCAAPEANREFCIRAIATHEFGHALSFGHEQNRSDHSIDCTQQDNSGGDTFLGPYDYESVMNYCNPRWNNNGNLSRGDILGIQKVYDINDRCVTALTAPGTSDLRGSCHSKAPDGECAIAVRRSLLAWDHFFTTDPTQIATCGAQIENPAAFHLKTAASLPGTTELHRCFNAATHQTFLTTDPHCEAWGDAAHRDALGLIATSQLPGTTPLYRLRHDKDHFFTVDAAEAAAATANGYVSEGVAGYVWSTATPCAPSTCASKGARCGATSDGCGGTLQCGTCAGNAVCETNTCVCVPTETQCLGRCGRIPDGCGGHLECGTCGCTPSCTGKRCGAGDGCGKTCLGRCASPKLICSLDDTGDHVCAPR